MDYKFEISLPNSSDFRCEIAIGGEQTFQQLHDKIVEVLGYDNSQMASFFTLDRLGNRQKEIALMDMAAEDEENDTLVMDSTEISDVVKPGCLELEYVFDFFANRYFKVEYAGEYIRDSSDIMPVCVSCAGSVPEQFSYNADKNDWDFDEPVEEYDESNYDDSFMEEFGNDDYDDEDSQGGDYNDEYGGERYESLDDYIDRL
jgi:hypothetical protein